MSTHSGQRPTKKKEHPRPACGAPPLWFPGTLCEKSPRYTRCLRTTREWLRVKGRNYMGFCSPPLQQWTISVSIHLDYLNAVCDYSGDREKELNIKCQAQPCHQYEKEKWNFFFTETKWKLASNISRRYSKPLLYVTTTFNFTQSFHISVKLQRPRIETLF